MKFDKEAGFTLLETLVALLIVSLAAALTLPAIADVTRRHQNAEVEHRISDEALSVLALAEHNANIDRQTTAFDNWRVVQIEIDEPSDRSGPQDVLWLEAVHIPSGEMYRTLIVR